MKRFSIAVEIILIPVRCILLPNYDSQYQTMDVDMEIQQMQPLTNILYMISTLSGLLFLLGILLISTVWSISYFFSWLF